MTFAADDDVVVDGDAEEAAGFDDFLGDLDVGAAGLGGAGGVVVDQHQRGGADVHRLVDHGARVDAGFVDGPFGNDIVEDQAVLGVEIEHAHAFVRQVRHVDVEIVDQRLPARQDRQFLNAGAGEAAGGEADDLDRRGGGFLDAGDRLKRAGVGVEHGGERAESLQQHAGERLYVLTRDGGHQQEFEDLVIGKRVLSAAQEPLAQAGAVAAGIEAGLANAIAIRVTGRSGVSFRK